MTHAAATLLPLPPLPAPRRFSPAAGTTIDATSLTLLFAAAEDANRDTSERLQRGAACQESSSTADRYGSHS